MKIVQKIGAAISFDVGKIPTDLSIGGLAPARTRPVRTPSPS
jgi:hypothetical protein